jgi:hypothetical protein
MEFTIKVENYKEFKKVEKLLKFIRPDIIKIEDRKRKIEEFILYTNKKKGAINKIEIPSRDQRNAE